ncbi:hypothetical protein C7446_1059 [Kushneria sinocarnis]|uniref:Uncharacterized protein n=1 Tax=Kushneria sinocarnis TaxID=595502 RepID=A0A420WY56_9GAMM|nr:hypothetical protein [Kushneria sinocarnis]RKR06123.1 hypothetical protein C7446_1059 [Kushneria sinocarnis]
MLTLEQLRAVAPGRRLDRCRQQLAARVEQVPGHPCIGYRAGRSGPCVSWEILLDPEADALDEGEAGLLLTLFEALQHLGEELQCGAVMLHFGPLNRPLHELRAALGWTDMHPGQAYRVIVGEPRETAATLLPEAAGPGVARWLGITLSGVRPAREGRTAGRSPIPAACRMVQALQRLPLQLPEEEGAAEISVTHLRGGESGHLQSPDSAHLELVLRARDESALQALAEAAVSLVRAEAADELLGVNLDWHELPGRDRSADYRLIERLTRAHELVLSYGDAPFEYQSTSKGFEDDTVPVVLGLCPGRPRRWRAGRSRSPAVSTERTPAELVISLTRYYCEKNSV